MRFNWRNLEIGRLPLDGDKSMAYTVTKLAKISGVSVRRLHWYDEVGLLKPSEVIREDNRDYIERIQPNN